MQDSSQNRLLKLYISAIWRWGGFTGTGFVVIILKIKKELDFRKWSFNTHVLGHGMFPGKTDESNSDIADDVTWPRYWI